MARADRLERLEAQRLSREIEYEQILVTALRKAAAGSWGLFGHNGDAYSGKIWAVTLAELFELGDSIDQIRSTLGLEPFPLHAEFNAARGPVAANAPGEPKQAKAWLERMGASI